MAFAAQNVAGVNTVVVVLVVKSGRGLFGCHLLNNKSELHWGSESAIGWL